MSQSEYTDGTYTATETDYTETANAPEGEDEETTEEKTESVEDKQEDTEQEAEQEQEEEKEPEPEPEPEPEVDPLEGLTYEDDPEAELPPYGSQEYWEDRYTKDFETFEWYQQPEVLLPLLKELVDAESRSLIIGNGTSDLPVEMAQNGFENVTAIDFSKTAIKKMRKRHSETEAVTWKVMDMTELKFPASEFQAVIDKGALDCLFLLGEKAILDVVSEISRVLKRRGVYVCVSCFAPEHMEKYLNRPADLLLELEKVEQLKKPLPSEQPHYVYVVRKISKLLT